jgi:hypothetical protein
LLVDDRIENVYVLREGSAFSELDEQSEWCLVVVFLRGDEEDWKGQWELAQLGAMEGLV